MSSILGAPAAGLTRVSVSSRIATRGAAVSEQPILNSLFEYPDRIGSWTRPGSPPTASPTVGAPCRSSRLPLRGRQGQEGHHAHLLGARQAASSMPCASWPRRCASRSITRCATVAAFRKLRGGSGGRWNALVEPRSAHAGDWRPNGQRMDGEFPVLARMSLKLITGFKSRGYSVPAPEHAHARDYRGIESRPHRATEMRAVAGSVSWVVRRHSQTSNTRDQRYLRTPEDDASGSGGWRLTGREGCGMNGGQLWFPTRFCSAYGAGRRRSG